MRRTPALTAQARKLYETEIIEFGWEPGGTTARVAEATGLTTEQVRDAIFGDSAMEWRQRLALTLRKGERNAIHRR